MLGVQRDLSSPGRKALVPDLTRGLRELVCAGGCCAWAAHLGPIWLCAGPETGTREGVTLDSAHELSTALQLHFLTNFQIPRARG